MSDCSGPGCGHSIHKAGVPTLQTEPPLFIPADVAALIARGRQILTVTRPWMTDSTRLVLERRA